MARNVMEINNITMDPNEKPTENYLIVQEGERYEDPPIPKEMGNYVRVECNKKTIYTCLDALAMDGRNL